jgi:4'-phosphopantetheinyl transferase
VEFLRVPEECGPASAWCVRDLDLGQDRCTALVVNNRKLAHIRVNDLMV